MKKKLLVLVVCVAVIAASFTAIWASNVGGADDPLVSVSYIENVLMPRIVSYINARLAGVETTNPNDIAGYNPQFEVVSVPAGRRIVGESGTEFIVRTGQATIIASDLGGISDVTDGGDLSHATVAPHNHLLIVPRSDGRGLNVTADALIMVRGRYVVQ